MVPEKVVGLQGSIKRLIDYHPYWLPNGQKNPNSDRDSKLILDLKDPTHPNHANAVVYFGKILKKKVEYSFQELDQLQVAVVPSSTKGNLKTGLEAMIKMIEGPPEVVYSSDFLVRFKTVSSAHGGGLRHESVHLNSISCNKRINPEIPFMLLDDVKTTGNSLLACEKILRAAGAQVVILVTVGRTV